MQAWVQRGDLFVHRRDGRIVAAVAVLDEDPEIWDDDDGAGYIHPLMVDPLEGDDSTAETTTAAVIGP